MHPPRLWLTFRVNRWSYLSCPCARRWVPARSTSLLTHPHSPQCLEHLLCCQGQSCGAPGIIWLVEHRDLHGLTAGSATCARTGYGDDAGLCADIKQTQGAVLLIIFLPVQAPMIEVLTHVSYGLI